MFGNLYLGRASGVTETVMENADPQSQRTPSDAEARLATILKCDIADSTRTWAKLDLSDGLKLTRAFRRAVADVVERHGGQVVTWEGDGALVLFGFPDAREDAPETAVRAGLQLVHAVRSVQVADVSINLRVGISSGRIAVDLVNKLLDGMEFNIAERLQAAGKPGWVVVTDGTKRLAKNFFEYDDLGLLPAKGFDQGLRAWRVVREAAVTSRFDAQRLDETRGAIVGRDSELAKLADAWSEAKIGKGKVVLLMGDPGLGKSRLAKAGLDLASRDGGTTLEIDCMPSMGNSPLYPVGVLLRRMANIHHTANEAETLDGAKGLLAQFFAEDERQDALEYLSPLFGLQGPEHPRSDAPEEVRKQTIRLIVQVLSKSAKQAPLAILCEDIHWADDTTATVVQSLAEEIANLRVMLVVTSRLEPDAPLRKIETPSQQIRLEPLLAATATDLVRSIAKDASLSPELLEEIVSRCDGIPLVLGEVTRGILEGSEHHIGPIDLSSTPRGSVPAPLQLIVESRLERWKQQKLLIQAASVLGREFSTDVLAELFPDRQSSVADEISMLADRGWFVKQGASTDDPLRFTHAMIRDAVNQTQLRDDRRSLHSQVADILHRKYQKLPGAPEVLAHHLYQATRFEESIETRLAASADTLARGAYVEAEGHCDSALKVIEDIKDAAKRRELHFKLLAQLGVALTGRHGYSAPQVEQAYRQAQTVCGEEAEAEMLYPIMRGLTALNLVRGNLAAGTELSLQAMAIADQSKRDEFQIDAMSVHCYAAMYYGSLSECRSWIERCLDTYHGRGGESLKYPVPNDAKTAALAILPTVEWLLGNPEAAEQAVAEGLAHIERSDRDFDRAYIHAWIAGLRLTQRRNVEAKAHSQIALDIANRHGFREWQVTGLVVGLLAQTVEAKDHEALKTATETCMAMAAEGVGLNASWYLWGLARGYKAIEQIPVAQQVIAQGFQRAAASGETRMNAELLILQAEMETDPPTAIALLESALKLSNEQGAVANSLRAAAALVLRSSQDEAAVELARTTHQILEGQADYPKEQGWMHARLAKLTDSLGFAQA